MTTAVMATLAVLSAAGLLPVLALVGLRWIAIPLIPLGGAILAAISGTCYLALGGTFMAWFVALATVGWIGVGGYWVARPGRRPWARGWGGGEVVNPAYRLVGIIGAISVAAACAWNLRGLSTPTVGFDARGVWLLRSGWFLQSHQQFLIDMRVPYLSLPQSTYPPLVSATSALAWSVTGDQSLRLGVLVIAVLNVCALAVAAFAVVEFGRRAAIHLLPNDRPGGTGRGVCPSDRSHRVASTHMAMIPAVLGVLSGTALVFVAFGITEPFMTNGYADPIWSLAAVGAVALTLQMTAGRSELGAGFLLVLVVGMSKDEGVATAVALALLILLRVLMTMAPDERRRKWRQPVIVAILELALIAAWPLLMRAIGARGQSSTLSSPGTWASRAHGAYQGMAPYLHVILLAAPLAVVGGLVLRRVRRQTGAANDWWAWAGMACGFMAVAGAFIIGSGAIQVWLVATVHRVTEFPALMAWWIIAIWGVVAGAAVTSSGRRRSPDYDRRSTPSSSDGAPMVLERQSGAVE